MPKQQMTYQNYLANWEQTFGDVESAEYWYWNHGQQEPYKAVKLSEQEFNEHLEKLNQAQIEFDDALKHDDDAGMGFALQCSFPHELALLV